VIHGPAARLHLATVPARRSNSRLVQSALPVSLAGHVTAAAWRHPELTVWLDSPAFCARMRFEAPRLKTALVRATGIAVERLRVRVKP
jgi:hypothetical protein